MGGLAHLSLLVTVVCVRLLLLIPGLLVRLSRAGAQGWRDGWRGGGRRR